MALAERITNIREKSTKERGAAIEPLITSSALSATNSPVRAASPNLSLQPLSQLIANSTESHTAAIFKADNEKRTLTLVAAQTLSRGLIPGATFNFGQGLVGWVAENRSKIAVCPFENDATTLMYYSSDQELKSFIALPIFSSEKELIGVLACDSKRSYAFSKIAEKVLSDCAVVAGQFIEGTTPGEKVVSKTLLETILETLRAQEDERALLSAASDLPTDLIERESLVVLCLSENGTGESTFFTKTPENKSNNRLLELVCRHKRLISRERSVQSINGDNLGRSFLSVPFRVLGHEAGSLNLLSKPGESFSFDQIQSLEKVATVIGHELERIRLASICSRQTSIVDWKSFELRANLALKSREPLALLRFTITNLEDLEANFGAQVVIGLVQKFGRLLEQLRGTEGLLCALHGNHYLLLTREDEKGRIVKRTEALLQKLSEQGVSMEALRMFSGGLSISAATPGAGTHEINALAKKTLSVIVRTEEAAIAEQERPKVVTAAKILAAVGDWKL